MKYVLSLLFLLTFATVTTVAQSNTPPNNGKESELFEEGEMTTEEDYHKRYGYSAEERAAQAEKEAKKKKRRERRQRTGTVIAEVLGTTLSVLLYVVMFL